MSDPTKSTKIQRTADDISVVSGGTITLESGADIVGGGVGLTAVVFRWDSATVDMCSFVAPRKFKIVGIKSRVDVAGTDLGAVTAAVKKAPSGTGIASGTALHTGTVDLKGTANANQSLTLSVVAGALDIAVGDAIGLDVTGVLTLASGCVTVLLAPA